MFPERLQRDFYLQDVLDVAPALIGKQIIRTWPSGQQSSYIISETEAYNGIHDKACHAHKGRTPRTDIMFREGGKVYMYLIYGMYWMFNIVSGPDALPQAVLIRGIKGLNGPGRLAREMQLDKSFYGEDLLVSERIWIVDSGFSASCSASPRINIDYAGEPWKSKPWRFTLLE